ncbi:MgtE intracellular N domain protein [compost metagenome]
MANTNVEGSSSYSALERFLIWFLIPFVFTAVLLGVLLSIFDYDIKSSIQKALHDIPLIGSVVPAPKEKEIISTTGKGQTVEQNLQSKDEEIAKLNAKLAELQASLQKSDSSSGQKDLALKEAQAKNSALEEQLQAKTQTDEEYNNQITQLANLYAGMTPSKAAPIMENLTLKERVLVFSMMKAGDRGGVLEKMDPKIAAETSIGIKDLVSAKDRQIAALQERLALNIATSPDKTAQKVSKEDLGQTFANMTPKSSAAVLLEMYPANSDRVLSILGAMDNASRSKVMSSLADASKETAAAIASKLAQ